MEDRIEKLKKQEVTWETDMGAWFPGERVVFRGKDLIEELSDLSFSQMIFFSVNGKIYEDDVLRFMHSAGSLCTSYPDPRLWNNRVAALAGTVRSTAALGIASASAVSEAQTYGGGAMKNASDLIHRAHQKTRRSAMTLEDFVTEEAKKYRGLPGYGRPVTKKDERIQPLLEKAKRFNIPFGDHLKLAFEIEKILQEKRYRLRLNVNGVFAAIMADIGITPKEYNQFYLTCFTAGMNAAYIDAENHSEGAFFPLSVERLGYSGVEKRSW